MKITNPRITLLLVDLSTLGAFASSAAASAAQPVGAPTGMAAPSSPLTDELLAGYQADEQADRGALFKGAVAKMEAVVEELKGLDVLVEEPAPAPVVIEAPPAAPTEPAPATLPMPTGTASPPPGPPVEPAGDPSLLGTSTAPPAEPPTQ